MIKHKLIDEVTYDEGEPFVYLKKGFRLIGDFSQDGNACQHCFGERNDREVRSTLKYFVIPCTCDICITPIKNDAIVLKQHGGSGRGQGRKNLSSDLKSVVVTIRLTPARRDKLRLLGALWLSTILDAN